MDIFILGQKNRLHIKKVIFSPYISNKCIVLEYHMLERDHTDIVTFHAHNLKYSDAIEVEIIVEFLNEETVLV